MKKKHNIEDEIRAYESSIRRKINQLSEMQSNNVKFQHQQGLKDEIYRLKRQLQKVKDGNQ